MAIKKNNYTPYLIGAAVLGLGAFLFKDQLKNWFSPGSTEEEEETPGPAPTVTQEIVTPGGVQVVQAPISNVLSPLGTPKNKLNFDIYLMEGMKGAEIAKLQEILNRMSKISGKPSVIVDGIFGPGTKARLSSSFGNIDKINLFKMYAALYAVYAANKEKDLKHWFNKYYEYYLKDGSRLQNAQKLYFSKNSII